MNNEFHRIKLNVINSNQKRNCVHPKSFYIERSTLRLEREFVLNVKASIIFYCK